MDQSELVNVIKTLLDGFDRTNTYLRQNIPSLIEKYEKVKEVLETLPKHAKKIADLQKQIMIVNENFSNE